ncbi:MAG TPA: F0F1 ATP synthase subunit A [Gaiellales bacterium]|nr:F0F1 ATP synthase subunit A [Gaiellales bacterium]
MIALVSEFNPVDEFTNFVNNPYVNLPLGLDINKAVVYLWLSALLAVGGTLLVVRRGLALRPDGKQTALESVYEVAEQQIARQGLPEEGMRIWFPYVATAFVFVWAMNVVGFLPLPVSDEHIDLWGLDIPQFQIYAATANLSVTLTLTLVTIIASHVEGIRYNGVIPYFRSWVPAGTPKPMLVILVPVEVLSQFVRVISLSVRLFANLLAGHLVIAVFLGLAGLVTGSAIFYLIQPFGLAMGIAIYTLEITLIAALQAFIFATLSAIYIGGAIHPDH